MLFEMLTGRTPFDGDLAALSYAHAHTPAPRVRSINPSVPTALDTLVAALLEKDPADRPQSGDDVRRSLDAVERQTEVTQTLPMKAALAEATHRLQAVEGVKPARRVSRRVGIGLAGLLGVIALIALIAARSPGGGPGAAPPSTPRGDSPATTQVSPRTSAAPSPEEAAGVVVETVNVGIEAGEVTGGISKEISHKIDEILRELDESEDAEKSIEKVDELREKVFEALEKGEITSEGRASAIDEALATLEEVLLASQ